ncbi:MAG: hypothetical protein QXU32_01480 [Nitrososphaerales archaeon]
MDDKFDTSERPIISYDRPSAIWAHLEIAKKMAAKVSPRPREATEAFRHITILSEDKKARESQEEATTIYSED